MNVRLPLKIVRSSCHVSVMAVSIAMLKLKLNGGKQHVWKPRLTGLPIA